MLKGKVVPYNLKVIRLLESSVLRCWLPSLVFLPLCILVLAQRGAVLPFDTLNLLVHEGGHLVFYAFGDLLHVAGGSLMQLVLPTGLALCCWHAELCLGAQVALLWLGGNALDLSIYVADARVQELGLLLNRQHDWHYLLGRTGLLEYDQAIAFFFFSFAVFSFLILLGLPGFRGSAYEGAFLRRF